MLAGGWMKTTFLAFWCLWAFTLLISRIYIYHIAYNDELERLENEKWLLEKCKEPEFYSNMRSHTDLCAQVATNARASIHLRALNKVAVNTHMCGSHPCSDILQTFVAKMGWQAFGVFALVILIFPNVLFALIQMMGYRGVIGKVSRLNLCIRFSAKTAFLFQF